MNHKKRGVDIFYTSSRRCKDIHISIKITKVGVMSREGSFLFVWVKWVKRQMGKKNNFMRFRVFLFDFSLLDFSNFGLF